MDKYKWSGSNPWLGLAPYSEETTLYGRSQESIQLSDIIKNNIASVVYGKSGIGKSSLLSAGISPILREENYIPIKIRLIHNSDVSYVEQIERRVLEAVNCNDLLSADIPDLGLWDFFHRHEFFTKDETEDCIPVIIIDQFEEIYTLTDADHKDDIPVFFKELSALLNDIKPDNVIEEEHRILVSQDVVAPSPSRKRGIIKRSSATAFNYISATTFRCVICLREDKLYLLERNSADIPSLKANRYNLHALSKDNALEVIMCPRPELFSNEEAIDIVDKLGDISDEGFRTVDPAILSLFLYKYYEKRGEANYDNIFADYYQESTNSIGRDSIAFLENHLLTLGGYRNQIPLEDALRSGVTRGEIDELLRSVILRTEKRKGIDFIEFSHDRLCAEAKKNREERTVREQARKARTRNLLSSLVFIVSVGILSFVLWQMYQLNKQQEEIKKEKEGRLTAEQAIDSLEILNKDNKRQKDSLLILNETNISQKFEIERQRDELQVKNIEQSQQLAEINKLKEKLRLMATADSVVIDDVEAGKLADKLPLNVLVNVSNLTISGDLNGTDLAHLRQAFSRKLKYLNLRNANIVKGGTDYYKGIKTQDNVLGNVVFEGAEYLETIILPNTIREIGYGAFYKCKKLETVIMPNSVKKIDNSAFYECSNLKSISIPNSITSIGKFTFEGCIRLDSINIPNSITSIGNGAFRDCKKLKSITIPNSVTTIGSSAFAGCTSLESMTIPHSVASIGNYAFGKCEFFSYINNSSCTSDDLWGAKLYNSIQLNGLFIHNNTLLRYKSNSTKVNIPDGITKIGNGAFRNCSWVNSVLIPESVTTIGETAFEGCTGLTSVLIPNGVTTIGYAAFWGCTGLTSILIPNSVTSVGESAFRYCTGLTSVSISNRLTSIRNSVFRGCTGLTNLSIPNSVTTIGVDAFYGCSGLASVSFPNSLTYIGETAFHGCTGLTTVTIPDGVKTIDVGAFSSCYGLTSLSIPSSVESIGRYAFHSCRELVSVVVPNKLNKIDEITFWGCKALISVTIPNSVKSIGHSAFENCESLSYIISRIENIGSVTFEEKKNKSGQFDNIPSNCTWYVPYGKTEEYTSQSWWIPSWQIKEENPTINDVNATYNDGVLKVNGIQYNMLPVEGGTFKMGTSDEMISAGLGFVVNYDGDTITLYDTERPVHEVTLDGYRIGETEVTQALWTAVMGNNPSMNKGDNLPVENVSWSDCQYFIHRLNSLTGKNFRLPTEAEWEFAARGGNKCKNTYYSGSNNPEDVGWYEENSGNKIHPVKQKRANELGLYDMSGNVAEYCQDIGIYSMKPQINPKGVLYGTTCKMRGGNVVLPSKWAYVSSRISSKSKSDKGNRIGLRLVISE